MPVVKAYCSERGFDVCTLAVQVYGDYGFTRKYPVEQLLKDFKITSIYEGTNGVQAMELLGESSRRKKARLFRRSSLKWNPRFPALQPYLGLQTWPKRLRQPYPD
jgi:hypothetical protein